MVKERKEWSVREGRKGRYGCQQCTGHIKLHPSVSYTQQRTRQDSAPSAILEKRLCTSGEGALPTGPEDVLLRLRDSNPGRWFCVCEVISVLFKAY